MSIFQPNCSVNAGATEADCKRKNIQGQGPGHYIMRDGPDFGYPAGCQIQYPAYRISEAGYPVWFFKLFRP